MTPEGKELNDRISVQLKQVFEGIAKTALQAANEAADDLLNIIEKMRKAHTRVALIVDESMRGLSDAHESLFTGMVWVMASNEDEEK